MRESTAAARYREGLGQAMRNLKLLSEAGIPIAFGTDGGPAGRFPGYFEHLELEHQIRRFRFEAGEMTQQELAEKAGCTGQTIGALEQGGYVPSLALAFRIARVFGAGVEEVFRFEEGEGGKEPSVPAHPPG